MNKYVDGNNKRTSAVCSWHTDTMRDASQLFYMVPVNTSLIGHNEHVMRVPRVTDSLCWLHHMRNLTPWMTALNFHLYPAGWMPFQSHAGPWWSEPNPAGGFCQGHILTAISGLPEDCNVMAEGEKQEITFWQNHNWHLGWFSMAGHSSAFDISLIHSYKLSYDTVFNIFLAVLHNFFDLLVIVAAQRHISHTWFWVWLCACVRDVVWCLGSFSTLTVQAAESAAEWKSLSKNQCFHLCPSLPLHSSLLKCKYNISNHIELYLIKY